MSEFRKRSHPVIQLPDASDGSASASPAQGNAEILPATSTPGKFTKSAVFEVTPRNSPKPASKKRKSEARASCPWEVIGVLIVSLIGILSLYIICKPSDPHRKLFFPEDLKFYSGERGGPLHLAILGEVFDVSKAPKFYGPGNGYHAFVGKDASRAFVTGDFKNDLNDDVWGMTPQQWAGLVEWRAFYRKEYTRKGRVVGRFYSKKGGKLRLLDKVERAVAVVAKERESRKAEEAQHPNCNVRWGEKEGGTAWCDEDMFPREVLSNPGTGGKPVTRCACFKEMGWSDSRRVYAGCSPEAHVCATAPPRDPPAVKTSASSEL